MKHDKHSPRGRDGKSKSSTGKDSRSQPRHMEDAAQEDYYGSEGYYAPMALPYNQQQSYPYPHYRQEDQRAYSSQNCPPGGSASAGPSLSAILNHSDPSDDYPEHAHTYAASAAAARPLLPETRVGSSGSLGSNSAIHSVMALHNALSPAVPSTPSTTASGPTDSSLASVALSDPRSATSASDAAYASYTYRSGDGYTTYASAEDFQKGKANLDYHYYHSYSSNNSDSYLQHQGYAAPLSRGTDRRTSGSSRSSRHHNAATSYAAEEPLPPAALPRGESSTQGQGQRVAGHGKPGRHAHQSYSSHLYAATPSSSAGISSPAFSVPDTPGQQTPRLASAGAGSSGSSEGGADGEYDNTSSPGDRDRDHGRDRDRSSAPSIGRLRSEQHQPAVQRERNRVAATKCRAKSKAAISKLEEEERLMSDQRQVLVAQKSALVDEMLNLREELLRHGGCESGSFIKTYIDNAARTIAESGGRNLIWGPDGTGTPWGESPHGPHSHHGHHSHHIHEPDHGGSHRGNHVKKENKRK